MANTLSNVLFDVADALRTSSGASAKRRRTEVESVVSRMSRYRPSIQEDGGLYLGYIPQPKDVSVEVLKSRVRKKGVRYLANSRTRRALRARMYGILRREDTERMEYHFMTLTVPRHSKYTTNSYEFECLAKMARVKFIQNLSKNYGLKTCVMASERQDGERKDGGVARKAIHWHIVCSFAGRPSYKHLAFVWLATLARHGFWFMSDVARDEWYRERYNDQINDVVTDFLGRQYRKIMDNGSDYVKARYDKRNRKNLFLLGCLDMEPVQDVQDFGAISSYLSCYMSKDRSEGTFGYRVSGSRGMKLGLNNMREVLAKYLEAKTGKVLLRSYETTAWRCPKIEVEREIFEHRCVDGELITTVKKVKREVRDYEQARMTPEKVKVWEFAPDCAYEITKYWGDSRVYHGCVKPPNRWQKDKTGNYNYRPGEGMKFDYFRWNANFDLWEQDEEFVKIMRETVGIEVQQKSLYYDYLGAKTPRKGDNSYIAR